MAYLYYPHAPILLRATKKSNGDYYWRGYGRHGHVTKDEVVQGMRNCTLLVLTDTEGKAMADRIPDITADRVRTNLRQVS